MDFDWKALVRTVAPGIASVFGTPLAGMGVTALLNILLPEGTPKPADPEDYISKALAGANPEMMAKLKEAEQKFQVDMKTLDIDLRKFVDENSIKDTAGARELKMQWLKSDKFDYEPILAFIVCAAFLFAEGWVFYYATAVESMEPNKAVLVGRVLGSVDAAFMLLLSFRWGRSRGEDRKAEMDAKTAMMGGK